VSAEPSRMEYVPVGPFMVLDGSQQDFLEEVVERTLAGPSRPVLVYALHVGGLNARGDRDFVEALAEADVVYADGGSVVSLARLAGARAIERSPTTDVGWEVLRSLGQRLRRPVRLALLGGPSGLAERAARVLEAGAPVQVVHIDHGYHETWSDVLRSLRESSPDVVLVGLGAPAEMLWCRRHRDELPPSLVLTCGGWFGHLTGEERRAPRLLRRSGIEWIARVTQAPTRLGPRYARGIWSVAVMSVGALRQRRRAAPR
jgi:N-acetylglucosaminyldiphosphoundecaprenol N-acetyl-beta-D-mannosaminyltransferase